MRSRNDKLATLLCSGMVASAPRSATSAQCVRLKMVTRADLPKFASNNRAAGTPEENKAVVQGSIFYFGSYSVNEADKTITTHIEVCSFPNWIGAERKSTYTINGDGLDTTTSGSSVGEGTVHVVYKRAK